MLRYPTTRGPVQTRPPRLTCALFAAVLSAALLPSMAQADVYEYGVFRYVTYTQTSNAQPMTPEFWSFLAVVFSEVDHEVLSGTLSFDVPPPVSHDLTQAIPTLHQYLSPYYQDEATFLLEYPETTYTLTVDRGFGPESGDAFLPVDLYCPEIPWLTGDTYDRLQSYNASLPFAVTINGFTLAPTTNEGSCSVVVIQDGVPGSIFSVDLQPVDTAIEIPAGTLQPATNYSIQVTYLNSLQTPNGGFGTAESGVGFLRGTAAHFTTLPANVPNHLGDMNCDDAVTVADIPLFVQALLATGAFGGCDINRADMNEDGLTNGRDTQPFVAVLLAL